MIQSCDRGDRLPVVNEQVYNHVGLNEGITADSGLRQAIYTQIIPSTSAQSGLWMNIANRQYNPLTVLQTPSDLMKGVIVSPVTAALAHINSSPVASVLLMSQPL